MNALGHLVLLLTLPHHGISALGHVSLLSTSRSKGVSELPKKCFSCKCWAKGGGNEGGGPKRSQDQKRQVQAKDGTDIANAAKAGSSSEDESWAVIIKADDAPSQGEPYDMQSALIASSDSALTKSEAELYDSGASRHMSPLQHRFTNLRSIPLVPSPLPTIACSMPPAWAILKSMSRGLT
jgi:hypothetical protein